MWRIHELYLTHALDLSDIPTQNNECVLHRWMEHDFGVVFITYNTFHIDLMDFYMFTLGTILYKKVVPSM